MLSTAAAAALPLLSPPPPPLVFYPCAAQLGEHLGLQLSQRARLEATLEGFALLRSSRIRLLREGDVLVVNLGRKRGAPTPSAANGAEEQKSKKSKRQGQSVGANSISSGTSSSRGAGGGSDRSGRGAISSSSWTDTSSSSSSEAADDSSSDAADSSGSSETEGTGAVAATHKQEQQTPATKLPASPNTAVRICVPMFVIDVYGDAHDFPVARQPSINRPATHPGLGCR